MKISTKRLQAVSTKTDNGFLSLLFELIPEQKTNVCGHYFKIKISELPREIKRCAITIRGIDNTYFPKAWLSWNPVVKSGNQLKPVIGSDSVTVEILVDDGVCSCTLESYHYLDAEGVITQLETFQAACNHSLKLFDKPFSFIFGQKPKKLIVSRQHPGESVASSFSAGILKFLQDNKPKSEFIIVPAMALRGLRNGEYRTNGGFDLNRSWMEDVEEIRHVKKVIETYGIEEVLDVHGDEVSKIDYTRIAGNPDFLMPAGVRKLAQPSWIRKILSRLRNRVKTASNGCSLRDYCKAKRISCTLLELSMTEDNSFDLGFEFAQANLK